MHLGVELDGVAWMLALILVIGLRFPLVSALSVSPSSTAVSSSISSARSTRAGGVGLQERVDLQPPSRIVQLRDPREQLLAMAGQRAAPRGWRAARCDRRPADRATRWPRPRSASRRSSCRPARSTLSRVSSPRPRPTRTRSVGSERRLAGAAQPRAHPLRMHLGEARRRALQLAHRRLAGESDRAPTARRRRAGVAAATSASATSARPHGPSSAASPVSASSVASASSSARRAATSSAASSARVRACQAAAMRSTSESRAAARARRSRAAAMSSPAGVRPSGQASAP